MLNSKRYMASANSVNIGITSHIAYSTVRNILLVVVSDSDVVVQQLGDRIIVIKRWPVRLQAVPRLYKLFTHMCLCD